MKDKYGIKYKEVDQFMSKYFCIHRREKITFPAFLRLKKIHPFIITQLRNWKRMDDNILWNEGGVSGIPKWTTLRMNFLF